MYIVNRLRSLKRTGELSLKEEKRVNLHDFRLKSISSFVGIIKHLDLSYTSIVDLEGLPKMVNLTKLIIDNTNFSSFRNFLSVPSLRIVSFTNTPLFSIKNCKFSLYLLYKDQICSVNGKRIPQKFITSPIPEFAAFSDLINNGWIAEFPCPSFESLKTKCLDYMIDPPEEKRFGEHKKVQNETPSDFSKLIGDLINEHEDMIIKAQAMFGIYNSKDDFKNKLIRTLMNNGVIVENDDDNSLVSLIKSLV